VCYVDQDQIRQVVVEIVNIAVQLATAKVASKVCVFSIAIFLEQL